MGGQFVLSLTSGELLVTSNSGRLSASQDAGLTWSLIEQPWPQTLWGALYQTGQEEVAAVNPTPRKEGGRSVQIKFGAFRR